MHRPLMKISEALTSFIVELFLQFSRAQFSSEMMTFRSKNNKITPCERLWTVDCGLWTPWTVIFDPHSLWCHYGRPVDW
jgi:hypothetical protein